MIEGKGFTMISTKEYEMQQLRKWMELEEAKNSLELSKRWKTFCNATMIFTTYAAIVWSSKRK